MEMKTKITNAFGMEIPSLYWLLSDHNVGDYVRTTLEHILQHSGVSDYKSLAYALKDVAEHVGMPKDLFDEAVFNRFGYELFGFHLLKTHDVYEQLDDKLDGRAALVYEQIKQYVQGLVLDLGCGDGAIGRLFAKDGFDVTLSDVYDTTCYSDHARLPFVQSQEGYPLHLKNASFDTVLLLTVLHHADDPLALLANAKRLVRLGGSIVAIESVYGVTDETAYGKLTHEEQRLANIFFDHFYNRIIHYTGDPSSKVNVPFNFQTAEGWKSHAEKLGLVERKVIYLGVDQSLVPEYHTLHVWDVP